MIVTVTFNPAIDKRYYVKNLSLGEVHRVTEVENTTGGKGLNVSRVASILGEKVAATGFLGGKNGEYISEQLRALNISDNFQIIKGETRCCLAIIDPEKGSTEFLEPGPYIEENEVNDWLNIYERILEKADIVVSSGSLPKGVSTSLYPKIINMANEKNIRFFLDTSGEGLLKGVEAKPYFVKPNIDELKVITNKKINDRREILKAITDLQNKGIELVTVSLGKEGSITGYKGTFYEAVPPELKAVNTVGSGDSFVAGMAVAICRDMDIRDAIRFASACGSANAVEDRTGFVDIKNVQKIFDNTIVNSI